MPIRRQQAGKKHTKIVVMLFGLMVLILVVTIGGAVTYYALTIDLPGIDTLKDYRPSIASSVYDDNNELIDDFFLEDRKIVNMAEIPKVVHYAFIAAEDSRFYQHQGFDLIDFSSQIDSGVKNVPLLPNKDSKQNLPKRCRASRPVRVAE